MEAELRTAPRRDGRASCLLAAALAAAACRAPRTGSFDAAGPSGRDADARADLPAPERAAASAEVEPSRSPNLAPLDAPSWVVTLPVPGFEDAMVAVPTGAREPRRLVVALHGNYDRPEWACGSWRSVAGPEPFVLCPRGRARRDTPPGDARFTYEGTAAAQRELDAAMEALRARYGAYLREGPVVYAGFSLGAIVGIGIVTRSPRVFPRVVLVEGGHDGWTADAARRFVSGGGERVMFVCSQPGCGPDAARAAKRLSAAGAAARVVDAGSHGHTYDGEVAAATKREWGWVVEGL